MQQTKTKKNRYYSNQLKSKTKNETRKETIINQQKRDKIKTLITNKLLKDYGTVCEEKIINDEVTKFISRDKLTSKDLQDLELQIRKKLAQKNEQENLRQNLLSNQTKESIPESKPTVVLPEINNNRVMTNDNLSVKSGMSGGSNLSKFNEVSPGDLEEAQEMKDFQKLNKQKKETKKKTPQIDYSKYNDEWDAINMYNKKLFEEERIINRIKDKEVKRRTKNDLDYQVKAKLVREYQERLKDREYDNIIDKHLIEMKELEKKKEREIKQRMMKEKESRDKQLRDKYVTKRIEVLKNKKFERELVKNIKEEIERDKKMALEKKLAEKEALQKTMKDNEIHKKLMEEAKQKEREEDIKMMEDDKKIKDKQEQDRRDYFKRIERNTNSFMDNAIKTVLDKQNKLMLDEERRMNEYIQFKNKMADLEEARKLQKKKDNQKMIKDALDKQMEERRLEKEYQHQIDLIQRDIWNKDTANYYQYQNDVRQTIRQMYKNNLSALSAQMNTKNVVGAGMSENEKLMNKDILDKC